MSVINKYQSKYIWFQYGSLGYAIPNTKTINICLLSNFVKTSCNILLPDGSELQEDEEEPEEEVIEENLMNIDKADKQALKNLNIFYRKQKKGTIDVWWLFDDGGKFLCL